MVLEAKFSEVEIFRRLWEPLVPSQIVQFLVGSAAAQYTSENTLGYLRQHAGEMGLAIERALARVASTYEGGAEIVMRQAVMQHAEAYRAAEERVKSLCGRLIAYAPAVQGVFGVKAEGTVKEYSLEITLEIPTGQKQVFMAPRGAPLPAPRNAFLPGLPMDAKSQCVLLSASYNSLKHGEPLARQYLAERLGAEVQHLPRL